MANVHEKTHRKPFANRITYEKEVRNCSENKMVYLIWALIFRNSTETL